MSRMLLISCTGSYYQVAFLEVEEVKGKGYKTTGDFILFERGFEEFRDVEIYIRGYRAGHAYKGGLIP